VGLATPVMPKIERGQVYNMVVVWFDEDTLAWNKRTYSGVMGRSQRVGSDAFQNLSFRAKRMVEISGFGTKPDLVPIAYAAVVYVNGNQKVTLYTYDVNTGVFTATPDRTDAFGKILVSADKVEIFIEGVLVATADATSMRMESIEAIGATYADSDPHLEFYLDSRVASLSKSGGLFAPSINEDDVGLASATGFVLAAAARYAVLTRQGVYAHEFEEV
jgi:hypothetical protein